ncbi:MAG: A/G-specific adenine glycosylase, partial [Nocardioides sp.]
ARTLGGVEFPPEGAPNRAERERAETLLPEAPVEAAHWSVAVMELGALLCTASTPRCGVCPVAAQCAWLGAGQPAYVGPPRKVQTYAGTDRQCRGRLLAVVREADGPVTRARLDLAWAADEQRVRCLESLVADGLLVQAGKQHYALP